jgi:hypothetical protein
VWSNLGDAGGMSASLAFVFILVINARPARESEKHAASTK